MTPTEQALRLSLETLENSRNLVEINLTQAISRDSPDSLIRVREGALTQHNIAIQVCHEALAAAKEVQPQAQLERIPADIRAALQLFITRCDAGEIRSVKTYQQFDELLRKYPE